MRIPPIIGYQRSLYNKNSIITEKIKEQNINFDNNKENTTNNNLYYPYLGISFGGERTYSTTKRKLAEIPSNFKLCRVSNLPCPACGKRIMTQHEFINFLDDLEMVEPENYLEFLSQYVEYMRPVEESVYHELCKEAEKPNSSTDIRTLLVSLRNHKMPILQEAQMRLIKKMIALANGLPEDEKIPLLRKIAELRVQIHKNNSDAPFRRKIMIDRISRVKISNPHKYEKLQNIAKSFPTSHDINSAWIVKYSGKNKLGEDWTSKNIAIRLLSSSVANTDHIIAYSMENHHDDISNYLAMHNACNGQKANKTVMQWLKEDNNRIKYLTDYFQKADKYIRSRKIKKKYRQYVAYATQTIFEASKGQYKIELDNNTTREENNSTQ